MHNYPLNQRFILKPLLFVFIITVAIMLATPVQANQLQVDGSIINRVVPPGEAFTHIFTVQNAAGDSPMEILVEAGEFAQGLDGGYYLLSSGSPEARALSAADFITEIDLTSFELAPGPGGARDVQVIFNFPQNTRPGTYYALINVQSDPIGGEQVGVVLAVNIPVVIHVPGLQRVEIGEIKDLYNEELASGEPVIIRTLFENRGNHHYKVKNLVMIEDAAGIEIAARASNLTASSVVPGYAYQFTLALDVPRVIKAGEYYILSEIYGEDGNLKDSMRVPLFVSETFHPEPFPLALIIVLIILFAIMIGLKAYKNMLNKRKKNELFEADFE